MSEVKRTIVGPNAAKFSLEMSAEELQEKTEALHQIIGLMLQHEKPPIVLMTVMYAAGDCAARLGAVIDMKASVEAALQPFAEAYAHRLASMLDRDVPPVIN